MDLLAFEQFGLGRLADQVEQLDGLVDGPGSFLPEVDVLAS
jgi:hypothetical protein